MPAAHHDNGFDENRYNDSEGCSIDITTLIMMMTMILMMMMSREGGWRVAGATLAAEISRLPAPWTSALRSPPPFSILHFEEDFVKSTT